MAPSEYLKRNLYATFQDDPIGPATWTYFGADNYMWASDFPHPDHIGHYMEALGELITPLPETSRQKILWENVSRVYKLGE